MTGTSKEPVSVRDSTAGERFWNSYRYLLFHCPEYYPAGGFSDFQGAYDTIEECHEHCRDRGYRHMQIVDMETNEYWEFRR